MVTDVLQRCNEPCSLPLLQSTSTLNPLRMLKTENLNTVPVSQASEFINAGGVVAYPTEAVWGFGCDPLNEHAVTRILELKQREVEKGLIIVAANLQQISEVLEPISKAQLQELEATWPGPVTWLIPDPKDIYPAWVKGQHASVAVRVSAHPLVRELCEACGGPIISTSANRAGEPEIRSRTKIIEEFSSSIDCIVEGELGESDQPSQIRDLSTGAIIR